MFVVQFQETHFCFAAGALQGVIPHGEQEAFAPGVEVKDDSVLGLVDCFMQFFINLPVPGVKAVISGHFEIFFRDVLYQQFDEFDGRKGYRNKAVIFMPVIVEAYGVAVIGIDPGKGDDRATKVAANIFDDGFRVAEIGFGINIKTVFVFLINLRLCLFKRRADTLFQFVQ